MAVIDGRTWLEHLSPPECWHMLSLSAVGPVGVLVDSAPEIYPVNVVVDEQTIRDEQRDPARRAVAPRGAGGAGVVHDATDRRRPARSVTSRFNWARVCSPFGVVRVAGANPTSTHGRHQTQISAF